MCLAQGHNAVTPVRLEPAALRSRVKHSTTEPLRSLGLGCDNGIRPMAYSVGRVGNVLSSCCVEQFEAVSLLILHKRTKHLSHEQYLIISVPNLKSTSLHTLAIILSVKLLEGILPAHLSFGKYYIQ